MLANAPFRPAIAALKQRPARREIDRRFVYIDPKPDFRSISFGRPGDAGDADDPRLPGFVPTILGAGGVERVVDIKMNDAEMAMFQKSVDAVKGLVAACKGIDPSLA